MKKIHVAIIDDGVNEKFFNLELLHNVEIEDNLHIINRVEYDGCIKSHGTICAGIIMKYCENIVLSSIKILTKMQGSVDKLCTAIEWCIDNEVNIINMSIGTTSCEDKDKLKKAIARANEKNIVIVAASSNEGNITYPAVFEKVIGVKCDLDDKLKEEELIYNINCQDNVEITCNSVHSLINYKMEELSSRRCNSYAAPLITAKVAEIKLKNPNLRLNQVKKELWKIALNYNKEIVFRERVTDLEWVENAIIFTMNSRDYVKYNSIFKIHSIVKIQHQPLQWIFQEIRQYLNIHSKELTKVDTIILDIDKLPSKDLVETLVGFVDNIVIMNRKEGRYYVIPMSGEHNQRVYINPLFNSKIPLEYCDDVPVVVMYDSEGGRLIKTLIKLSQIFKSNGYNAISFIDNMIGLCYGLEYITLEKFLKSSGCKEALNNRINYLNGDIGFIGIANHSDILKQELLVEEKLDIDIYMLPEDKKANILKSNNKTVITFNTENKVTSGFIEELYRKILKCYGVD